MKTVRLSNRGGLKLYILSRLRKANLLCRKTTPNYAFRKKISKTVYPYNDYKPNTLESSLHIHFEVRKKYKLIN